MSHEHESPTPENISTDERFPHSGKHGFEKPVREFDKTSLEQAVDVGLINPTPESPAALPKEKGKRPLIIGGSALAAALIAGGAWLGLSGGDKADEPKAEPTASAPASPGETPATAETPLSTGPVELSVEKYQDPETLVRAYVKQEQAWIDAGKDKLPATIEDADPYPTNQAAVDYAIGATDDKYVKALFVEDWESNPSLVDYVEERKTMHDSELNLYFLTIPELSQDDADIEPYDGTQEVSAVRELSSSDDERVIEFDWTASDNSALNRGGTYLKNPVDGTYGTTKLTFANVDGIWKVSDWR